MKTDPFQSYGHCWVFQIWWHNECSTFTTSSFRIWNSSTGILSLPLASFIVMLPKDHLTLHSRMCGTRWVITPSWLSGSWISFFYSSSVYSCHYSKYLLLLLSPYHFCPILPRLKSQVPTMASAALYDMASQPGSGFQPGHPLLCTSLTASNSTHCLALPPRGRANGLNNGLGSLSVWTAPPLQHSSV